jgi:comEA protein
MVFTKAQLRALWFIIFVFAAAIMLQYAKIYIFSGDEYDFSTFDSLFTVRLDSILAQEAKLDTLSPQKYQKLSDTKEHPIVIQQFPVNINQATVGELEALPRIGPAMAARIVDYREENGPFSRKEDLMGVKGVGTKTFARLKDLITLE